MSSAACCITGCAEAPLSYGSRCREHRNEYMRGYYARNPDKRRRSNIRKYNLTLEEYDALLEAQGGVCEICRQPETMVRAGKVQSLSIDHCHVGGDIRGLLCSECNNMLGKAKDSAETLRAAAAYLDRKQRVK